MQSNTSIKSNNPTSQSAPAPSFERPITRAAYMDGSITHQDYYAHIAMLAGIKPSPALVKRAKTALKASDKHLNTIPLHEWDQMASGSHYAIQKAVKQVPGETNSLATGVCVWKAATRAMVQA